MPLRCRCPVVSIEGPCCLFFLLSLAILLFVRPSRRALAILRAPAAVFPFCFIPEKKEKLEKRKKSSFVCPQEKNIRSSKERERKRKRCKALPRRCRAGD